jgi:hypothetical protein
MSNPKAAWPPASAPPKEQQERSVRVDRANQYWLISRRGAPHVGHQTKTEQLMGSWWVKFHGGAPERIDWYDRQERSTVDTMDLVLDG